MLKSVTSFIKVLGVFYIKMFMLNVVRTYYASFKTWKNTADNCAFIRSDDAMTQCCEPRSKRVDILLT